MKALLSFLILLPVIAYGQLQGDTLLPGSQNDFMLTYQPAPCYPYSCEIDRSHTCYLPLPYNGGITIYSFPTTQFEILIIDSSGGVRIDTCATVYDPMSGKFELLYYFEHGCSVSVNGPQGVLVRVISTEDPTGSYPSLPSAIADMDTMCATYIATARETVLHYMRMDTGEICDTPLSAGIYFEMDETFVPTGRKILVIESE